MHEEDEILPNEKSHAYHFSNRYGFCLLTPPAILALPKCLYTVKDGVCKFVVSFA